MNDCLDELASFSLLLQCNSINFEESRNRVFLTKKTMKSFKNKSGFCASQTTSKFSGIQHRQNVKGSVSIPPTQFSQAIIDSNSARSLYLSKNYRVSLLNMGKCYILLNGQRLTLKTLCLLMPAKDECIKLGLGKDDCMREYVDEFK